MAGKNEVTLTFAGDSKSLERTFDKVGSGAKAVEADLNKVGRSTDVASGKLERAGESADNAETRFTGLASGIDGVTTLLSNPSPQEFAQGIADMADGVANSAAPALQTLRDKLTGATDDMDQGAEAARRQGSSWKGLAIAGGVAVGVGALTAAVSEYRQASQEATGHKLADEFFATGDAIAIIQAQSSTNFWNPLAGGMRELNTAFSDVLEQSPSMAESFIEQAESAGAASFITEGWRDTLERTTEAQAGLEEATRSYSEALQAQFDPMFGMIDAQQRNVEAQAAVEAAQVDLNKAIASYGVDSATAQEAQRALSDAQLENAQTALGVTSATDTLATAIRNGDVSMFGLTQQMAIWDSQGLLTDGVLQAVADRMGLTIEQARQLGSSDPNVDVTATDWATAKMDKVADKLRQLDGRAVTTYVDTVHRSWGSSVSSFFAEGGVAGRGPLYLAGGGPRGTDTVPAWLTPGEMVLNAAQQAELWAMANGRAGNGGGGGPTYIVHVAGSVLSDRDLARKLRELNESGALR